MTDPNFEVWSRGQIDSQSLSKSALQSRLAETIAWCNSLSWPNDLRSNALKPYLFHNGPDDLVCSVGRSRQTSLRYGNIPIPKGEPELAYGRLLVYFPDMNLSDGAAEVESEGFFDVFNVPPFDTWVTFFEDKTLESAYQKQLLCYVPAHAVQLAEAGVQVNPEECILWLDQAPCAAKELISKLKFCP
jgi:hypothetical protein